METGTIIFIVAILGVGLLALIGYLRANKKEVSEEYFLPTFFFNKGSMQSKILYYMNKYREDYGIHPLVGDRFSNILAGVRVGTMIENGVSHEGFATTSEELIKKGADCVGENIAYGYGTAQGVVNSWFNSEGHRKNMLNKRYDWCGIYVKDDGERNYFCVIFGGDDIVNG